MDSFHNRDQRTFIKLLIGGLVGFLLFLAIAIGGYRFYNKWEARRQTTRARTYLGWGDTKSAALAGRRAFQLDSANAEACRVLAETAEREGQPAAVEWRRQVTSILPKSTPDAIALARTALQFGQTDIAEAALAKVGPEAEQQTSYHEVEAQLAVTKKDPAAAERHFAEAVRLDPDGKENQLNLAVFQLQSASRETRDRASVLLQRFMDEKPLRVPAARALRDYAAQRKDGVALLGITELLYGYPEATFRDRISYLQVLQALGRPESATILTALQNEALTDTSKLVTLLWWMNNNHQAVLAIDWSKQFPAEIANNHLVRLPVADCYVTANDPDGLRQWCKQSSWGDLDFLRHAYLAWAARAMKEDLAFQSEWNSALQAAGSKGEPLLSLEQTAAKWKWKDEAENLLWQLVKDPGKQVVALAELNHYYSEKGDTAQLYRAIARLCEIKPNDDEARNNLANLSLLLNLNVENANTLAEQLYQKAPENAVFASTYAFSLYRKQRYQPAVDVMRKLKPAELEQPAIAAYYAIFLAAAGDREKAAEYLERGSKARLLPEEKALLDKARQSMAGRG
ncbi:MAG TPA: hypothetical protein VGM62_05365 [Chthoniobacterales bacterium]